MSYEELLEYLDITDAAELEYFETMADLIEAEDYIEQEALYQLFDGADNTLVAELLDDYFTETLQGLPEDSREIYMLLDQIRLWLGGSLMNASEETDMRRFTDEFYKFRNWFTEESEVELLPEGEGPIIYQCLRDAITTARIEKLGGDRYRYCFENALNYEMDSANLSMEADSYS